MNTMMWILISILAVGNLFSVVILLSACILSARFEERQAQPDTTLSIEALKEWPELSQGDRLNFHERLDAAGVHLLSEEIV
jgi:hypothetical protein